MNRHKRASLAWVDEADVAFGRFIKSVLDGGVNFVAKNIDAFRSRYPSVPVGIIFGPYDGQLSNGGEKLEVGKPADEVAGTRYYIRVDRVNYDDEYPWPVVADGGGLSLQQKTPDLLYNNYSNDVINWEADTPTAGQ